MATNLAIDESLLEEAQEIGQQPTKKATVTQALEEYVKRRKRLKALKSFGKIAYRDDYDYKKDRRS